MSITAGKGKKLTGYHSIYDGIAHIYQVAHKSGDVWQFRMWINDEKKHYRKSLKTKDFNIALSLATDLALELSSDQRVGKQIFGITLGELVDLYIEYREKDIQSKDITKERWLAIGYSLKYIITMLGRNKKVSSIKVDTLFEYRHLRNEIKLASLGGIRNEMAIINHMWKWGYRHKYTNFGKLEFRKISGEIGKRNTFTDEEYDKLVRYMRSYCSKKECPNNDERIERQLVRDFVLISSNSCARPGELRKLTWGDVLGYEEHLTEGEYEEEKVTQLVELKIRKDTSKVRKERIFLCRGGQYFKRLKDRQKHTNDEDLVFSLNGKDCLTGYKWVKHWKELMKGIGIKDSVDAKLSYYSLRHFGITARVQSGLSLVDISYMAGTSVSEIERTYLKYRKEQSRTSALKSYRKNKDGTITTTDGLEKPRIDEPEEESDGWAEYDEGVKL